VDKCRAVRQCCTVTAREVEAGLLAAARWKNCSETGVFHLYSGLPLSFLSTFPCEDSLTRSDH